VEPEIVARALNNIEHLIYNKFTFDLEEEECRDLGPDVHLARFLEEMGDKATSLKKLDMKKHNYYHVSPMVMAKAFNKLENLELKPNPATTSTQIAAILQLMAIQTNVVNLKIYDDISWLSPGLLAGAVVQVEQVDMLCKLSTEQVSAVLGHLDNNSRMKRLNLGINDLSEIPGHVLENAVDVLVKNGGTVIFTQSTMTTTTQYIKAMPPPGTPISSNCSKIQNSKQTRVTKTKGKKYMRS